MEKEEYLELGLIYIREGNLEEASKALGTALVRYAGLEGRYTRVDEQALGNVPPELLSYYGLCLALVQNRIEDGIRLCKRAILKDTLRPEFYLNLGKAYLKANQKAKALKIFQRGLEVGKRNRDILYELRKMGIRKKQVIGFLPRGHFINRYAGLLLHRAMVFLGTDKDWDQFATRNRLRG